MTDDEREHEGTTETEEFTPVQNSDEKSNRGIKRKPSGGLLSFRNIALISVFVAGGAVAYELLNNPEFDGASKIGSTPNLDATPAGDQLANSERYEDNLRRQNQKGAQIARDEGSSFVATPDEPLRDVDGPNPAPVSNPNRPLPPANERVEPVQPKTIIVERPAKPEQQKPTQATEPGPSYNRINQLAQLMASQQQGLVQAWQAQPSGVTLVVEQDLLAALNETPDLFNSGSSQTIGSAPDLYARAGDVVLASTIITNDSDTPGPVVVEIRRGPLKGARLVGGFQANTNNTHLIVQFNSAVLPDGSQVPVSAYAVDARHKSLAIRTDLDRRLFQRYAPRVAAAFVTGLGDALSDTGSTLVDLGGVAAVTSPQATFEQGVYQGLSEVGNDLAQEFVRSAPKGPLISLRTRQIIGVLFTANVEEP